MADAEYDATNGASEYQEAADDGQMVQQEDGSGGEKINASKNDDDESRKIFVGGLSWETTVKDLREYFEKFGEIADCTLKTDPHTLRSRGFGFVLFNEAGSVDKVIAQETHTLHGRHIDPKRAKARGGREPIKKVFVGGLDPDTPEADIRDFFQQYGKIEEIDLPFDKVKNQRRAFCFIIFESEEIADAAVVQAKQVVGSKEVDVKKATPKNEQFGQFGRGGWGPRGRGGFRGRGRGDAGGGWNQGGYGNNYGDYNNYYSQGYGQGYGGYDYNNYYNNYDYNSYYNQGWGNQGYGNNYGNYGGRRSNYRR